MGFSFSIATFTDRYGFFGRSVAENVGNFLMGHHVVHKFVFSFVINNFVHNN